MTKKDLRMKRSIAALTTLSLCLLSHQTWAADTQLKDKKDKISYSIGIDIGKAMQKQKIDVNSDAFMAGFKDGQTDKKPLMTEDEMRQTLTDLQKDMMERQKTQMKELGQKNLTDGQKFLDENKKNKDVVTLPSGLQYKIIKEGKGESPKANDMVTTNYVGKLINGTEFDNSYKRGEPVKFNVSGVIPAWTEALQLMKPGAKWELFVPPKLAYGENGVGQIIGPNSTLIFEVELVSVDKDKAEKPKANNQSKKADTKKKASS